MLDHASDVVSRLLRGGTEHVVSHHGRSQYSAGDNGASSCGLAALNCARIVLQRELEGSTNEELIREMLGRNFVEEVLDICLQWSGSSHLDVEDISAAPIFSESLLLSWSAYVSPGLAEFEELLNRLTQSTQGSAALIVTRPPEIINVIKIANKSRPVFITFDSHPRPKHPNGAAFIFHPSAGAAASYLSELLRFDSHLLSDPTLQWQAQLLANCSAHAFLPRKMPYPLEVNPLLMKVSLQMLQLKAEVGDLRAQCSEMTRLQTEVDALHERNRRLEGENLRLSRESSGAKRELEQLRKGNRSTAQETLRSTKAPESIQRFFPPQTGGPSSASSSRTPLFSQPVRQTALPGPSKGTLVCHTTEELDEDGVFATLIQLEWRDQAEDKASRELAEREQQKFDEENRQLSVQAEKLKAFVPKTFECGICLDEALEDMVSEIELCGHKFCRTCMHSYLTSKLGEHRFPILCPTCSADRTSRTDPGTINSAMAQIIGLSDEEYALFTELELAAFSVLLHCRKCQQAVFVDKEEYDAQKTIVCPLPSCNYVWCKACSREIEIGGPPHSCDGSAELNHLMNERGWKNCPGCRTPVMKGEGCNHMTCIAPGCNTHFCYRCGATIVQSVLAYDIKRALTAHYAGCQMIEFPW